MLRQVRFQSVRVCISTALPGVYIYSGPYAYSILTCAKFNLRRTFPAVGIASVGACLYLLFHNTKCNTTPKYVYIARFEVLSALFLRIKLF
jgi:hypothetical protein